MEDEVLWDEQHNKSDIDSIEEGDEMYNDMMIHQQIQQNFNEESDDKCFGFE